MPTSVYEKTSVCIPSNIVKTCIKTGFFAFLGMQHISGISHHQMHFLVWKTQKNQLETTPKKRGL